MWSALAAIDLCPAIVSVPSCAVSHLEKHSPVYALISVPIRCGMGTFLGWSDHHVGVASALRDTEPDRRADAGVFRTSLKKE